MKTIKENILESRILFLIFTFFILSFTLFTSCSETENILETDDTALIAKIESATKTEVEVASLPAATANAFNDDLYDSYIESAALAEGLGFKIAVITNNASRKEYKGNIFFNVKGRQLIGSSKKFQKKRHKCFEFVFPIDFLMPDTTTITLTEKADWVLIKEWYETNPALKERAEIVFPLNISLKKGTIQTLLELEELKKLKNFCKNGKNKIKCFKLILPVNYTMPDATTITVVKKEDFKLLRSWYKANKDSKEKGVLNYPVKIMYQDDTTAVINDETEMQAAKKACK
jgi:hypothetical protein